MLVLQLPLSFCGYIIDNFLFTTNTKKKFPSFKTAYDKTDI